MTRRSRRSVSASGCRAPAGWRQRDVWRASGYANTAAPGMSAFRTMIGEVAGGDSTRSWNARPRRGATRQTDYLVLGLTCDQPLLAPARYGLDDLEGCCWAAATPARTTAGCPDAPRADRRHRLVTGETGTVATRLSSSPGDPVTTSRKTWRDAMRPPSPRVPVGP